MTTNKSGKIRIYLYVLLTIAGCVFACSSIIPNDYISSSYGYSMCWSIWHNERTE